MISPGKVTTHGNIVVLTYSQLRSVVWGMYNGNDSGGIFQVFGVSCEPRDVRPLLISRLLNQSGQRDLFPLTLPDNLRTIAIQRKIDCLGGDRSSKEQSLV